MRNRLKRLILNLLALLAFVVLSPSAQACAACFSQNDGPMARGMNAGIFTLLGVIGIVLCGFFALMIYLVRRGAAYSDLMDMQVEAIRLQNEGTVSIKTV